jgi:copper transport protein
MDRMKRAFPIVAVVLGALWLASVASAHANLVRSSPANHAVVKTAPKVARFVFDDPVRVASGIRAVRNGGESVLAGKPSIVGSRTLVVPLSIKDNGDYTVLWRIVSDDGHTEAGVVAFAVGSGRAPPSASLSAGNGPSARDVVSRWLVFAGLLVAAGGAVFRIATGVARTNVLLPSFVATFLGASALLPHTGTLATRFGAAYVAITLLAALGATAAALSLVFDRAAIAAWAFALALIPLPSIAGHALDSGRPWIEVVVDAIHIAAAAAWIGGLVQLALVARDERVVRRFSSLALGSIAVIAATGVIRALTELRAVSQLWTTGYGRLLLVKSGLLVVLVAVGWLNRYRLIPRNAGSQLRRSVFVELALLTGLVAAVAGLTAARPGRDYTRTVAAAPLAAPPPLPGRQAVVDARQDASLAVAVAVTQRDARVTVLDSDGLGAEGLNVKVLGRRAADCGPGCYDVAGFKRANPLVVTINGEQLRFRIPHQAPDARTLVARATRRFRALQSVTYLERLESDPAHVINTRFTLERPNRLEYHIRGGVSAIVIGTRRWDSAPDNTWVRSQTSPLVQPTPVWDGPVANAHLVGQDKRTISVTFLNPNVPAWFHVDFDRATLLPRTARMTAPAHFMFHRYVAYNRPRTIRSPGAAR